MSEQEYPMHGYLYHADGRHGPPEVLATPEELWAFVGLCGTVALEEGREVLVCSGDDEACFLHIKHGAVVYGSGVEPQDYERAIRNYAAQHGPTQKEPPLWSA